MKLLLSVLFLIGASVSLTIPEEYKVPKPLLPDEVHNCCLTEPYMSHRYLPVVYCYSGIRKTFIGAWMSGSVKLYLDPHSYDLYEGPDNKTVWTNFEDHSSSWTIDWLSYQRKSVDFDPFDDKCIGIKTERDYKLMLEINDFDGFYFGIFFLGTIMFYFAPSLSNNQFFYYITVILTGVFVSVMIFCYYLTKLLPFRQSITGGLVTGTVIGVSRFFINLMYDNTLSFLIRYQKYVLGYIAVSALVSSTAYYRLGPITNPRTKTIVRITLQILATVLMYYSTYIKGLAVIAVVILLISTHISIGYWLRCTRGKIIRPVIYQLSNRLPYRDKDPRSPRRLLTKHEYEVEGYYETMNSLSGLREYCIRPEKSEFESLSRMLRLKHQDKFIKFLKNGNHLNLDDIQAYTAASDIGYYGIPLGPEGELMDDVPYLTDDSD